MPMEPTSQMIERMGLKKPPRGKKKLPSPNFMSGSQTIDDILMGLVGQDTGGMTNKLTQLIMAGLPVGRKMLGTKIPMGAKGKPIFDEANNYLGMDNPVDEVFNTHVGSSVGKFDIKKKAQLAPSVSTIERMMGQYRK